MRIHFFTDSTIFHLVYQFVSEYHQYPSSKDEVKNKVKSIAMKLGIVKTEEDDYLD